MEIYVGKTLLKWSTGVSRGCGTGLGAEYTPESGFAIFPVDSAVSGSSSRWHGVEDSVDARLSWLESLEIMKEEVGEFLKWRR